jgi:iron complex outermembrane receptor protein/outer membrane receptor for ferrienterochelin and colicins
VSAKFGYEYDDDSKLYMTVDYHDNERGIPTESFRYWEFKEWEQWHVSLAGEHDFTDLLSMKARLYYMKHDDTLEDVSWDAAHTTQRKWFQTSSYDDYSIGGEIQGYLDFGDISLVKMGFSYMKANNIQREYLDATSMPVVRFGDPIGWAPDQEYEVDIYSFGIEDDIRVTDKMTLTAGVSYDVHDPVKAFDGKDSIDRDKTSTWNPQAGVSYDFTQDFTMYASVGKKTRFPQMKELYSDLAGGNTDLDPQQTIAWEIGATKRFNHGLSLSGALFYNDITDRIDYDIDDNLTNIGETEIKGVEAQLKYQSPWNLDLGLGYTFLSATDKADEVRPELDAERIPEHKFFADARYFFDFGLTAACQAIYTSDQVEYDRDFNPRDIDEFWVVNARLNQDIKLFEKISTAVFLEVKNLFDEDYEEGSGPYPGRNFLAGMQFSF